MKLLKQKVLEALQGAKDFEDFHFTIDGIECFVSRDIYPKSVFSAGVRGCSTSIYKQKNLQGTLNAAYAATYQGDSPTAGLVASKIFECYSRTKH